MKKLIASSIVICTLFGCATQHGLDRKDLQGAYELGRRYEKGLGVKEDDRKAFQWYEKAANLGSAEAMWSIANLYGTGKLGGIDMMRTCAWAVRAGKYATDDKVRSEVAVAIPQLRAMLGKRFPSCEKQAGDWSPAS